MHCYVYKGDLRDDHYLYLAEEIADDSPPDVPAGLLTMLGDLSLVIEFDLTAERKLPQAEARQVIQDIGDQGFYLQMPKKDMRALEDQLFN